MARPDQTRRRTKIGNDHSEKDDVDDGAYDDEDDDDDDDDDDGGGHDDGDALQMHEDVTEQRRLFGAWVCVPSSFFTRHSEGISQRERYTQCGQQ